MTEKSWWNRIFTNAIPVNPVVSLSVSFELNPITLTTKTNFFGCNLFNIWSTKVERRNKKTSSFSLPWSNHSGNRTKFNSNSFQLCVPITIDTASTYSIRNSRFTLTDWHIQIHTHILQSGIWFLTVQWRHNMICSMRVEHAAWQLQILFDIGSE